MRVTVYAEWDIVEYILLFKEDFPNLYNILTKYSELCLNLSEPDIDVLSEGSESSYNDFVKNSYGYHPIPLKYYFEEIYDDISNIADHPRALFLLNLDSDLLNDIKKKYGMLIMSENNLDDSLLCVADSKTILPSENFGKSILEGWSKFLNREKPPYNALVISDRYLFENGDGSLGVDNIIAVFELLLPFELEIDFHLTLLVNEPTKNFGDEEWHQEILRKLKEGINSLNRNYPIIFEITFSDTVHPRVIIGNYFRIKMEVGFNLFKLNRLGMVQGNNEFEYETIFFKNDKKFGENIFEKNVLLLNQIKEICRSLKEDSSKRLDLNNFRLLGDCHPDKSIKNRLINSV